MSHKEKISVIGAGAWGTAVANVFSDAGCDVLLYGRDAASIETINKSHQNPKYLGDLPLNPALRATHQLSEAISFGQFVVCAVPTQQIRSVFSDFKTALKSKTLINTAKGIEEGSHQLVCELFDGLVPGIAYVSVFGPSFAKEVVQRLPTAVTAGSQKLAVAQQVQKLMSSAYFRVYSQEDVVGVELGGSLKNVIAIACGMIEGLGLGLNAQAALINRGLAEMVRLGKKKGAKVETCFGLSGMGDLILTCTGGLSRNRRFGIALGQGKNLDETRAHLGGVAEGYYTARSAYELAVQLSVDTPIIKQVYRILYEGSTVKSALTELMGRELKSEWQI